MYATLDMIIEQARLWQEKSESNSFILFRRENLKLQARSIIVEAGGALRVGTAEEPYRGDATLLLDSSRSDAPVPVGDGGLNGNKV